MHYCNKKVKFASLFQVNFQATNLTAKIISHLEIIAKHT